MDKIWDLIRTALLALFGPPDVDDEAGLRKWIQESLAWLDWIAKRTDTKIDDQIAAGLRRVVEDDAIWGVVYDLLVKLLGDGVIDEKVGERADVAAVAGRAGIPIGMFVQVLMLLLKLLRK